MNRAPLIASIGFMFIVTVACEKSTPTGTTGAPQPADPGANVPQSAGPSPTLPGREPSTPQAIAITVGEDGFSPSDVQVRRGDKVVLRFTRITEKTCATAVAFPELDVNKPLPLNQAVDIVIPTEQARTLTFQCGMGMYKSKLVIR